MKNKNKLATMSLMMAVSVAGLWGGRRAWKQSFLRRTPRDKIVYV